MYCVLILPLLARASFARDSNKENLKKESIESKTAYDIKKFEFSERQMLARDYSENNGCMKQTNLVVLYN